MTSKQAIDELIECAKFDLNKWLENDLRRKL